MANEKKDLELQLLIALYIIAIHEYGAISPGWQ